MPEQTGVDHLSTSTIDTQTSVPPPELPPFDREKYDATCHSVDALLGYNIDRTLGDHWYDASFIGENFSLLEQGLQNPDTRFHAMDVLSRLSQDQIGNLGLSAAYALSNNMDIIEESFEPYPAENANPLKALVAIVRYGDLHQKQQAMAKLGEHVDSIEVGIRALGGVDRHYYPALRDLIQWGSIEQKEQAKQIIRDIVEDKDDWFKAETIAHKVIELYRGEKLENGQERFYADVLLFGEEMIHKLIEKYGIDPKTTLEAWEMSAPQKPNSAGFDVYQAIKENLKTMAAAEQFRPGIVKQLHEEFGITDFGRYAGVSLDRVAREANITDLPYGVIVYPRADWNGAFYQDTALIRDLQMQVQDKHLVRIVEAGDKVELRKRLHQLNQRYGANQKISFAIIGGHGSKESIQFGQHAPFAAEERKYVLEADDLLDPRAGHINWYFAPYPTIMLFSCSTGFKEGIGQKLSETMGATVIAPDQNTSIKSVTVKDPQAEHLEFEVTYNDATSQEYNMGKLEEKKE